MSAPVVVVGAGFGGLAAACHLRRLGHDVLVVEAESAAGGRANVVQRDGFRFDTGPTVVTMIGLLDEAFRAVGAERSDHCTLSRLDPVYAARFADGTHLSVRADTTEMAEEIGRFSGRADAEGFRRFVEWTAELYRLEFEQFINRDIRRVTDLLGGAQQLAALAAAGGFRSWFKKVSGFFSDERLRRLFSFQAMYAGLSPLEALGLFAIIAHMDTVQGVYAPQGGVHALATGLAAAAAKDGVEFRYNTAITRIDSGGRFPVLHGADGSTIEAAAVVANPDLPIVYDELLGLPAPRTVRRGRYSPSCVVWHLGAHGDLPDGSAHHNIHFGHDWDRAFAELLEQGRPMSDPSRFVTIGSLSDATAAPAGGHALFILEPVPNLDADVDWVRQTPVLTERMRRWADAAGYPAGSAELMTVIDPPQWRHRGAAHGTPFSLDHRFLQSGPFRPAPEDRRVPGIVFCGSGTRPGVGLPMVLISGRIAAERTDRALRRRARP